MSDMRDLYFPVDSKPLDCKPVDSEAFDIYENPTSEGSSCGSDDSASDTTEATSSLRDLDDPLEAVRFCTSAAVQHRSGFVTALRVSSYVSLLFGLLALYAGAYPRWLVLPQAVHMLACVLVARYSNVHHEGRDETKELLKAPADDESVTISFDSSGWCFFYHLGVALYLHQNFAAEIASGKIKFSGSSGGALVAAGLECGVPTPENVHWMTETMLNEVWPLARVRPWLIRDYVRYTLETVFPADAHKRCSNRLRVLLTRVSSSFSSPFLMGEVATEFEDREHLFDTVCASSHIPVVFGWPLRVGKALYVDGMSWPSMFVPWRAAEPDARVCRVSASRSFGSNLGPPTAPAPYWTLLPPSPDVLRGMLWRGYRDAELKFSAEVGEGQSEGPWPVAVDTDALVAKYEATARWHWAVLGNVLVAATAVALGTALCVWWQ